MGSLEEQKILEAVLDKEAKPPRPTGSQFEGLHYLLWTPFRYRPAGRGSRFGSKTERGIWYGATDVRTALTERAFQQLLFLNASLADFTEEEVEWSAFEAAIKTDAGINLEDPGFAGYIRDICNPISYADSLKLGSAMRAAGVEAFLFPSARCFSGKNVGLFEPVFANKNVADNHSKWTCFGRKDRIEVRRKSLTANPESYVFLKADFEVDGKLHAPAFA